MRLIWALLVFASVVGADPLLDGKTIRLTYRFPDSSTQLGTNDRTAVVGAGVEFADLILNDAIDGPVDVTDTNIRIEFTGGNHFTLEAFNGAQFSDSTSSIAAFTAVTVNADTTLPGFGASRVTFDSDNIFLNFRNLGGGTTDPDYLDGFVVSIDVAGANSGPVPEPGTCALIGMLLVGYGIFRRRRNAS